jgi:hypothetical protein
VLRCGAAAGRSRPFSLALDRYSLRFNDSIWFPYAKPAGCSLTKKCSRLKRFWQSMPHHDYSFGAAKQPVFAARRTWEMPMTSRRRTCFADDAELARGWIANLAALFTPGIFNPYQSSLHQRGDGAAMWTGCNFNRVAYAGTHWPPDRDERRNQRTNFGHGLRANM